MLEKLSSLELFLLEEKSVEMTEIEILVDEILEEIDKLNSKK